LLPDHRVLTIPVLVYPPHASLKMRTVTLLLIFLAATSRGRRIHIPSFQDVWNDSIISARLRQPHLIGRTRHPSASNALTKLLLRVTSLPAWQCPWRVSAWAPCSQSRLRRRSRPLLSDVGQAFSVLPQQHARVRQRTLVMQIKDQEKAAKSASTLELQPEEVALQFFEALSDAWSSGTMRLAETMRADASVETPIWNCATPADYERELSEAQGFFSNLSAPVLKVVSKPAINNGRVTVEWMLGLEWPAIWRPRVNILGESTLTITPVGGSLQITRIDETWHQSPLEVFTAQVLPKFRDVASFWNSPTAEYLPMPVASSRNGYDVMRIPPMLALQVEWTESGSMIIQDQSPVPPSYAFPGVIGRSEWYNCISPAILERSLLTIDLPGNVTQTAQRRRWICPLPTRFGADPTDFPEPDARKSNPEDPITLPSEVVNSSASVRYLRRPSQMLALTKLKAVPSFDLVLSTVTDLAKKVEADGYKVLKRNDRPVVMQLSSDIKYGFNSQKQLARLVWLSVPDFFKEEYVGIVIDEGEPLPGDEG